MNAPVCHFCGQFPGVTRLVVNGDELVRPAPGDLLEPFRRFVEHTNRHGRRCEGSNRTLAVARGFSLQRVRP